jgi:hypothetical protein
MGCLRPKSDASDMGSGGARAIGSRFIDDGAQIAGRLPQRDCGHPQQQ